MGAKVYELNAYKKKKKKENQLSIFEHMGVFLNFIVCFSLGCFLTFIISITPKYPVFTFIFTICTGLFLLYHAYKTILIYTRKKVKQHLKHFFPYIMLMTVGAFFTCLLSFGFVTSTSNKVMTFSIGFVVLIINIVLLIKLSKRDPDLFA